MRKQKFIFIVLLFFAGIYLQGQTSNHTNMFDNIPLVTLPHLDMDKIEQKDSEEDASGCSFRFGYEHKVDFNLDNSGIWSTLPNGDKVWLLKIYCPEALSINLVYDKFWLSEGAQFYIYGNKHKIGPFISKYNLRSRENPFGFATELVYGDTITLEYRVPKSEQDNGTISISSVIHGYRNVFLPGTESRGSGSCQVNVNCIEGAHWQNEKNAVAKMICGSKVICTGALINNTANDTRPLFLTAEHCKGCSEGGGGEPDWKNNDTLNFVFYWNFESPTCNPTIIPGDTLSKCTYRAIRLAQKSHNSGSDFQLFYLLDDPKDNPNITPYYLGWDRTGNPGTGGVGIHHPKGDVKKISTYNITPVTSNCIHTTVNKYFWKINWIETANAHSVPEGSSSGSPLLNNNHHVIGQLLGPFLCPHPYCDDPANHFSNYGKFSASWDNGTEPEQRLKDWLDPIGTNQETLDGIGIWPCAPVNVPKIYTTVITTNTVWTTNRAVHGAIIINSGVTLTVLNTDVLLSSSSYFLIHPRGRLIIDGGTLTNACPDQMWQGISISGDNTLYAMPNVEVKNGGKIENAITGIHATNGGSISTRNAQFVNNAVAIQIDPVTSTQANTNVYEHTQFIINDNFLGAPLDFEAHIKLSVSSGIALLGCTLVNNATLKSYNAGKNYGISAFNSPLTLKEYCPCGMFDGTTGICIGNCMIKNLFSGFNVAISASNSGTTPATKVRCSVFEENLNGIIINGINNHELIKNDFHLRLPNSYGVSVSNATGYKIEENVFKDILPAPNKITVGLSISNSGSAENEVYKNDFKNLYAGQNFLCSNATVFGFGPYPGLQTLCNTFSNNQRDIHMGTFGPRTVCINHYIRNEQGSVQKSAGNQFSSTQIINIDNTPSPHTMNYHYINANNEYPAVVANVSRILATSANTCPSKIGNPGGGTAKGSNALAQYDEWNAEYEYWFARAMEICGEWYEVSGMGYEVSGMRYEVSGMGYEVSGMRYEVSGDEDEECSVLWAQVSHYSALKDNYFNSLIVAVMDNYELPITNYDDKQSPSNFEGVPEGRGSLYETLRFLFSYRGQYGDYLSISETYLAENNYTEALETLSQIYEQFKLNEEQISELQGLETYIHWLQQLEEAQNSIYTLSESELNYLINYVETHTGRGTVFAKNILCELYGICIDDEIMRQLDDEMMNAEEQKSRKAENDEDNLRKSVSSASSACQKNTLENIKIFPNPTTGELTITNYELQITSVEIYDVYGRNVYISEIRNSKSEITIIISHLQAGIYFARIETEQGEIVKKIVKE